MKSKKDIKATPEQDTYFDRLEKASPSRASLSIIAKIMQELKLDKKS